MNTEQQFASIMKNGLARSNRFEVIIPLPNVIGTTNSQESGPTLVKDVISIIGSLRGFSSSNGTRDLNTMIEQTEIPGKNLTTTDIRYNGDFYKLPYSVVYGAQQFTFRVSRDMYEKNIIDSWMNKIFDPSTHEVSYMDDYVTDITINQLDNQDNVVYSVVLKDAFPSMCNPLTLSNEEQNQFHRVAVQFMYRKWYRPDVDSSGPKGIASLSQTPLGPFVTPILSNPAVQRGLEIFERETGIDLDGEASNVYNQVDEIVKATTGRSINQSVSLIEGIKAETVLNDKINNEQKAKIIEIIDETLNGLRS